jgi:gamma-glutamyltranspeptidase
MADLKAYHAKKRGVSRARIALDILRHAAAELGGTAVIEMLNIPRRLRSRSQRLRLGEEHHLPSSRAACVADRARYLADPTSRKTFPSRC